MKKTPVESRRELKPIKNVIRQRSPEIKKNIFFVI
jgi:hypothetical protein